MTAIGYSLFQMRHGLVRASTVGFGGFRLRGSCKNGEETVAKALQGGVNVFDTSSHFANGVSETILGKALNSAFLNKTAKRENIVVISKCGHILDRRIVSEIKLVHSQPNAVATHSLPLWMNEAAILSDSAAHCISPVFIADQISQSLERTNLDYIDVYMLNCPERLLSGTINGKKINDIYHLLLPAFKRLEEEVNLGRIKSYGIASNSLANPDAPDYIDIAKCATIAQEASNAANHQKSGNRLLKSSFNSVEYPLNLFEREAVESLDGRKTLAEIAEENELYQFTQRPLNVISGWGIRCLGDKATRYEDEAQITSELSEIFEYATRLEIELSSLVGDTADDLNTVSHFIWAETLSENLSKLIASNAFATTHYVSNTVLPTLSKDIEALLGSIKNSDSNQHTQEYIDAITMWTQEYQKSIEKLCNLLVQVCHVSESAANRQIASVLSAMAPSATHEWRELEFTAQQKQVDMHMLPPLSDLAIRIIRSALVEKTRGRGGTVLVGMTRPSYVDIAVQAGKGGLVSKDDVESAFMCSLLE